MYTAERWCIDSSRTAQMQHVPTGGLNGDSSLTSVRTRRDNTEYIDHIAAAIYDTSAQPCHVGALRWQQH